MSGWLLAQSDARRIPLRDGCVQCVVTSPPYFALRDYGVAGQIGLEPTPAEYVAAMVGVFREVRRVLRDDGTLWLNIGDSYCNAGSRNNGTGLDGNRRGGMADTDGTWEEAKGTYRDMRHALKSEGIKHKDRMGIPHRLVFALQDDGWYWRDEIVWHKPNPMPESVTDRTTKAHEMVFLLTKRDRYFYDQDAVREAGSDNPVTAARRERTDNGAVGTSAIWGDGYGQSGKGCNASVRAIEGRNLRSVWSIPTTPFPGAHFATMPPELAERCVKAGTSEHGCCPACGAPWRRLTESERVPTRPGVGSKVHGNDALTVGNRDPRRHVSVSRSVGWEPSCSCPPAPPVPCLVLDLFNGAGTSGLVATRLGRRYVGFDLNPAYLTMASDRIAAGLRPVSRLDAPKAVAPLPGQLPLFA